MARRFSTTYCEEITTIEGFDGRFGHVTPADGDVVVQGVDLTGGTRTRLLLAGTWGRVTFLGCPMADDAMLHIVETGGTVFPPFDGLPYNPYRGSLYTTEELAADDLDERIYRHQAREDRLAAVPILEALAERIHDHAIDDALAEYLSRHERVVAIMGGHEILRNDQTFARVALVARSLARTGHLVVTGGGPGAMEAGNLGAWLAPHPDDALADALDRLASAPSYSMPGYRDAGADIVSRYPHGAESLAIPTWFYGHEPTNAFATAVAKYFSNSIREDGLLAIATHGVIYSPGSAGTVQEVFMDATQNHYATFGLISPMVFLDSTYWTDELLGAPRLLRQLAGDKDYSEMIAVLDEPAEVIDFIDSHPPRRPR